MEQKLSKHYYSNENKLFKEIVVEFCGNYPSSLQKDIEKFIDIFYKECQKEKRIFDLNKQIQLNKLTLSHVIKIQEQLDILKLKKELGIKEAPSLLYFLEQFCKFLTQKDIAKLYYILPKKKVITKNKEKLNLSLINGYENYLNLKRYSSTTIKRRLVNTRSFLKFLNYTENIQTSNDYWLTSFKLYEDHLNQRSLLEKILPCSAYEYLVTVRSFSNFLYEKKEIKYIYQIPNKMIQNGDRSNEFTNESDILLVIKQIFERSKNVLRDISIFLIILETGCRPIEIVNLKIEDVNIKEKLIVLKSKKSHQRTLLITDTTCALIKDYLIVRNNYFVNNNDSLFLNIYGNEITSSDISNLFRKYNNRLQEERRFTPKSLRHTFITNSLENGNTMEQIRAIVGHKHLISTHYYFYRNIDDLKNAFKDKKLY
ncbi:tyrosine-type recombinase/integrase [Psychrobacillus sp. L4]|uniref:tyrosine-type recombinase/integrase n=1 Tax=Psychrobacillus sp. L4 TaxID=3236892 RepID=UPI0036F1F3A7